MSSATRPGALFSRKMNSEACLLYSACFSWCRLPSFESSFAPAPSPRSYASWACAHNESVLTNVL